MDLLPLDGILAVGIPFALFRRPIRTICPSVNIEVFPQMNHGQLLVDHPEEVAQRIMEMV